MPEGPAGALGDRARESHAPAALILDVFPSHTRLDPGEPFQLTVRWTHSLRDRPLRIPWRRSSGETPPEGLTLVHTPPGRPPRTLSFPIKKPFGAEQVIALAPGEMRQIVLAPQQLAKLGPFRIPGAHRVTGRFVVDEDDVSDLKAVWSGEVSSWPVRILVSGGSGPGSLAAWAGAAGLLLLAGAALARWRRAA